MDVDQNRCIKPAAATEPEQGLPADTGRAGRGAPKGNANAQTHGLVTLKNAVVKLGGRAIDGRYRVGRQLQKWRREIVEDLGGADCVSTQQNALIDLAVKSKLLLDSIDAWLLTQDTLVNKRKRSILPAVIQRQGLADGLARYLSQLGLERRHKIKTLQEILSEQDDEPDKPTANGHSEAPQ